MRPVSRIANLVLVAAALAACGDTELPTGIADPPDGPVFDIQDASNGGGIAQFHFLPPMVPAPTTSGVFDPTATPTVTVLECGKSCASKVTHAAFSMTEGSGSETIRVDEEAGQYAVNWHTDRTGTVAGAQYRIVVRLGGMELGHADIVMAASQKEAKNLDTGNYIALVDGRTLPIKFRIEQGLASPAHAAMTAEPDELTADGQSTSTITVQLTDANGTALSSGTGYTVALATNAGTLSEVTNNGDGTFTATLTAPEEAGTATIIGALNGAEMASSATVTFTEPAPEPVATTIEFVTQPSGKPRAGVPFAQQPVVKVLDQFGQPFANADVNVKIDAKGATLGGTTDATTDADGKATFPGLSINGLVGDYTFTFSVGGETKDGLSVSATISLQPGPAVSMVIDAGNNQTATVGTAVLTAPAVKIVDAFNNGVPGVEVSFTASTGGAVSGSPAITSKGGIATVGSWTLATTAGENTLTATAGLLSAQFTATGTAGDAAKFIVTCTSGCAADNKVVLGTSITLSAQLADQYGNPVAQEGLVVKWTGDTVSEQETSTNAAGVATLVHQPQQTERHKFTFTATSGTITGVSPEFTVVASGGSGGSGGTGGGGIVH